MPILEVEIVGPLAARASRGLARRLADAAGTACGASPGRTWVRVRRTPTADYAESGGALPPGVRPVFVRVLLARPPRGRARAAQAARLADAVARACGRPRDHVHVLYAAPALGRIAFGGRLLR
jgi:phenylpyruvate tautomerase PptA (4-oxalocrotonate tautomerase family)